MLFAHVSNMSGGNAILKFHSWCLRTVLVTWTWVLGSSKLMSIIRGTVRRSKMEDTARFGKTSSCYQRMPWR